MFYEIKNGLGADLQSYCREHACLDVINNNGNTNNEEESNSSAREIK